MAKRSYAQFCPIAYSLDLVGERWTLLILRELASNPQRFTDLRTNLPGVAPNLLTDRLRSLTDAGLVTTRELPPPAARTVYELTGRGTAIRPVLAELARWGLPLLGAPEPDEHFPAGMIADGLAAMVVGEELPDYAARFLFAIDEGPHLMEVAPRAPRGQRVAAVERVSVTPCDPPVDADLVVEGSLPALLWLRTGAASATELRGRGMLTVAGLASALRDFAHMWGIDATDVDEVGLVREMTPAS